MSRHIVLPLEWNTLSFRPCLGASAVSISRSIPSQCASLRRSPLRTYSVTAEARQVRQLAPITRKNATRNGRRYATWKTGSVEPMPVPVDLKQKLQLVQDLYIQLDRPPIARDQTLPDEKEILTVLATYDRIATILHQHPIKPGKVEPKKASGATSVLLRSMNKPRNKAVNAVSVLETISNLSTALMARPTVFLSAPVLQAYVDLQIRLNTPQHLAHVFDLYHNKAVPYPSTRPPYYILKKSRPQAPSVAVPKGVAEKALDAALQARDMSLALRIIDSSLCTKAYIHGRIIRSAGLPVFAAVLTPVAAYVLASKIALIQQSANQGTATFFAMASIMTYVTAVSTIGYVAFATANDQMVRVQWVPGMRLWERWAREHERAAADMVAQAWGFADKEKWGDERGEEWEELREWCGVRGMILDKVDLLPGMQ